MFWKLFCFVTIFSLVYCRYFILGPAKIKLLKVEVCKECQNCPVKFEFKSHMYNTSTQLLDAFWIVPTNFDETVFINLKCSRIDKRKTQVNSFVIEDLVACQTVLKYMGDLWIDIQTKIGMEPGVCPIKMGNYTVKNMNLDLSKLNVQAILEGRFKTRVILKQFTKMLYCGDFTFELSPKNE